jgi:hypothetical protein
MPSPKRKICTLRLTKRNVKKGDFPLEFGEFSQHSLPMAILQRKRKRLEEVPSDRRRADRVRHASVVELHDGDGQIINGIGQLIDFSMLGICFMTRRIFKTGDLIQANVRLPHQTGMTISGRIVRVEKKSDFNHYGVEFNSFQKPTI